MKDQLSAALKAEIAKVEAGAAAPAGCRCRGLSRPHRHRAASTAPAAVAAKAPTRSRPSLKKPSLTIRCLAPAKRATGAAVPYWSAHAAVDPADGDLAGGASLRFLRRGDARAQLALAPMRQGETIRSKLPPELCAGVASTKVEIQVMGSGQVVDTLGPYTLRC